MVERAWHFTVTTCYFFFFFLSFFLSILIYCDAVMPRADGLIQVLLERRKWCQWVPGRSHSPTTTRSSLRGYVEVEDFLICINFRIGRQLFFCYLLAGRGLIGFIEHTHTQTHTQFHILYHAAARVLRDIQRTCVSPPRPPRRG